MKMRQTEPETKDDLLDELLANSVYMPDSGMVVQLRKSLSKLSKSDLINLLVLVDVKQCDAAGRNG